MMTAAEHVRRGMGLLERRDELNALIDRLFGEKRFGEDSPDGARLRIKYRRAKRELDHINAQIITELENALTREHTVEQALIALLRQAEHNVQDAGREPGYIHLMAHRAGVQAALNVFNGKFDDVPGAPAPLPSERGF